MHVYKYYKKYLLLNTLFLKYLYLKYNFWPYCAFVHVLKYFFKITLPKSDAYYVMHGQERQMEPLKKTFCWRPSYLEKCFMHYYRHYFYTSTAKWACIWHYDLCWKEQRVKKKNKNVKHYYQRPPNAASSTAVHIFSRLDSCWDVDERGGRSTNMDSKPYLVFFYLKVLHTGRGASCRSC